jgi:uncharacterized protein YqhQ
MKNIGGQAVIEGVMMKAPRGWTVAVRDQKGAIHLKIETLKRAPAFFRMPLLRGVVALCQAFSIGIKALEFSASKAYSEADEKPMNSLTMASTIGVALLGGVGLFIFLPLYLTKATGAVLHVISRSSCVFNAVDGIMRVYGRT